MKKLRKPKPKRLIIWAAKGMFKSASKLATALKPETDRKVLIVRSDSPRFKPRPTDITINWGNSIEKFFYWGEEAPPLLNHPYLVARAVNKLKTFQALDGKCNIPAWTTDPDKIPNDGSLWVARQTLTGFGGEGINLFLTDLEDGIPEAPLYVQYKKKKKEFRIHVFKGEVIDVTQKKKRSDFNGEINTKIRNYGNGWVYCREDLVLPADLLTQAKLAIRSLGLDFGAVDIIWNEKENKSYVLECNTAPGLEGTTIEAYKNAILSEIN